MNDLAAPLFAHAVPRSRWRWVAIFAGTALGYALVGRLALLLAIPPGYATPLYPSAGLALAAVLTYGWRVAPAVALGSFAVNLWLRAPGDALTTFAVPALIGLGAMAQAMCGAALIKRFARRPLVLSETACILLFYLLGAFVACTVNASLATVTLFGFHVLPSYGMPLTWLTWWFGDSLGTVIGAPIVLTLIGQPRAEWAPRRLTVGLTLCLVTTLLAASIYQVGRWEERRARDSFDREADAVLTAVRFKLQETLHALAALHGVYIASERVDRDELRLATAAWLRGTGQLRALGYAPRVPREALPAFEEQARNDGQPGYRVSDRPAGDPRPDRRVTVRGDEAFAIRLIEPAVGNLEALGVNLLSVPDAKRAIERSIDSGQPVASRAFLLSQDPPSLARPGVVVYHALFNGTPRDAAGRRAQVSGVVFAALRADQLLTDPTQPLLPGHLRVCLLDRDPGAAPAAGVAAGGLLGGPPACAQPPAGFTRTRAIEFAGRPWQLRVDALPGPSPIDRTPGDAWLFAVVGLLSTAVLGGLLLVVTGRTRRIEVAVHERTAALQQQVHEREQAEAAMRASEQRFRNIFNNVPLGVVYTDLAGDVKQTNPHFCQLVGHTADALLAMNDRDYLHPDDLAAHREAAGRLLAGAAVLDRRQQRYVTAGGRVLWVRSTVSLLRDEHGVPQRIVSTAEDITENLRLADADRARKAAEASNRAKSDFLSRMSHELRTPLNAMLGFAQLLELDRRQPLSESQRPWVAQIQQAGWHLLEMINDVLDLSRIESGNLRLAAETLVVDELLSATLPLLQREARARDIAISDDLAPDAGQVLGDATRVKQILTNLLSNAIKYNVDGGRVHLRSRRRGDFVDITVTDTGLGMTAAQMAELFQPFNRLGRERTELQGTGIGLVISQRLAELMGGALQVGSNPGEGSTFTLSLPFVDNPDTVPAELDVPAAAIDYRRRRVHYVEDNETNVEVMRGILAQRPQVEFEVSTTGLDGLASIRARRPDVILLDMHLPDISGMELLRHLGQDPGTASIPVVAVSADALESQIVQAESLGASRYLTKPVNVGELLAVLDELLGSAETRFG